MQHVTKTLQKNADNELLGLSALSTDFTQTWFSERIKIFNHFKQRIEDQPQKSKVFSSEFVMQHDFVKHVEIINLNDSTGNIPPSSFASSLTQQMIKNLANENCHFFKRIT
ncbi:hypothetical protein ACOBV9_19785 (plasmid) [Pseudoalteromonas espejiana]